jgi:hypothetical protein
MSAHAHPEITEHDRRPAWTTPRFERWEGRFGIATGTGAPMDGGENSTLGTGS